MSMDDAERLTSAEQVIDELVDQYDVGPETPHRYHPARARQALMAAYIAGQSAAQAELEETVTGLQVEVGALEATIVTLQAECDMFASTCAEQAVRLQTHGIDLLTADGAAAKAAIAKPYGAWD